MILTKLRPATQQQWLLNGQAILNKSRKILALTAIILLMTGCKVVIKVPEGGRVVSDNGIQCLAGQTCVLNVDHIYFDEKFRAVPDEGYEFEQWQESHGYFCGGWTDPCPLFTTTFGDWPILLAVLAADYEFFLAPEFSSSAPADGGSSDGGSSDGGSSDGGSSDGGSSDGGSSGGGSSDGGSSDGGSSDGGSSDGGSTDGGSTDGGSSDGGSSDGGSSDGGSSDGGSSDGGSSGSDFVDSPSRYNVSEWATLLANLNTSAFRSDSFLYQTEPDTGNCNPGVLKSDAKSRFTYALNLIRKLHHLPPVEYDDFYSSEMQQAALVQLANNYLTHSPRSSDACYTAAAASGAGSSNLSSSSIQRDPAYYPIGWANDNRNISAMMEAGHRRWLLYPQLGYTSYGQTAGYSSMKVFGFGQPATTPISPDVEYIAFPYGGYPHVLVSKGGSPTPWSLSMVPPSGGSSSYNYFQNASVEVKETATNSALTVHSLHHDSKGYGLRNFLSWMVDGWNYDTEYTVTIRNVQMPDSSVRDIVYPVRMDYAPLN